MAIPSFGTVPFGTLLKQARLVAGLSQETLAERAGISAMAVSALERGARRRPHLETVGRLADALGLGGEQRAALLAAARPDVAGTDTASPAAPSTGGESRANPVQFPPPLPKHNLPEQLSTFIGRQREQA